MKTCAIDIHHHYVPTSLLDEAKRHGKTLGVELKANNGAKSLSFAGGPPFVLHPELPAVEERLKMMQDSKLAAAALEAHTATLGYRLTGEQGETWCRVYNEGIKELITRHPDRFVGIASVPLQDPARAAKVLEDAFPDLKLCVLHGGGFFPYHLGRFDQGWHVRYGARAAQAKKPPSAYLKNIYYDNMIYRVDTIDYLRKLAGANHIMVGTDYPYNLGDWKAVEKIEALDCPESEKELMLEGNAKRLLKI